MSIRPLQYQDINAATIDRWIEEGWEWGKPISHDDYVKAQRGEWDVLLTPTKPVPHEWFGDLRGKKVLGLASGGGQQMPIFAALGADCTVLDYFTFAVDEVRSRKAGNYQHFIQIIDLHQVEIIDLFPSGEVRISNTG